MKRFTKRFMMWTLPGALMLGALMAGAGTGSPLWNWPNQIARADVIGSRPRVLNYTLTNMGAFPHVLFLEKSRESIFSFVQEGENVHSSRGVPPEVALYAIPDYAFAGQKLVKAMRAHNWKEFRARCQDVEPLIRRLKLNLDNYRMGQPLSSGDGGMQLTIVPLKTKGRPNGRFDVERSSTTTANAAPGLLDDAGGFRVLPVDVVRPDVDARPTVNGTIGQSPLAATALLLGVPLCAALAIALVLRRRNQALSSVAEHGHAPGGHAPESRAPGGNAV